MSGPRTRDPHPARKGGVFSSARMSLKVVEGKIELRRGLRTLSVMSPAQARQNAAVFMAAAAAAEAQEPAA